ncbi:MAG: protein kinase, partial [Planctomycetia bacterium]|nr:protein kinase [Planctomycetia bacterium]
YLVMEYVDGCDLQVLVQRKGPLDYIQVADFSRQAASGLAHAHECGLIHRDIKPANLLVDERGTVKILDLGLARFFDDRLDASLTTTHNESILGTADYLSPEQALDSHNVDTRTDIYSLGCTCYYMLTGHPPFPEGSVAQRLMSHQSKSPKAIEKIRPDAPTDLVTIVEKMLAKSPDDRYQAAREVADAFTEWLAKHGGEDWKKHHREIVEGSVSHIRREPTRSRSAATEETDLELGLAATDELGLAPMEADDRSPSKQLAASQPATREASSDTASPEELGLDQLEELSPLTTNFETGSPSGGLDSLLNEALDNYPALDSNPNLVAPSNDFGMGSGVQRTVKPTPGVTTESNQLLKLILIGFAVSVPLSVVILVVSSRFSTPAVTQVSDMSSDEPREQVTQPPDELVSEPPLTSPATPVASETRPQDTDGSQLPDATTAVEPAPSPNLEPTVPEPPQETLAETVPATPSTPTVTTQKQPVTNSTASPEPSNVPPETQPAVTTSPTERDANRDDQSNTKEVIPSLPSPQRIKELLASLSVVTIKLDRKPKNTYDLMVLKTAEEALVRAGLKVTLESQEDSDAVLTLSFEAEKAESFYVFNLGAELKCRDGDSQEVSVWKHQEEVGRLRASAVGNTPPSPLRGKVSSFYSGFVKDYRQA